MDKDTVIKMLKSEQITFTLDEISEMMDEELGKSPDEMDTELVDACLEVLTGERAEKPAEPKKARTLKFSKLAIAAAAVFLIICVAVPVSARYTYNNVSDKIVEFYSEYFKVNLREGQTEAVRRSDENNKFIKELKENGVENVVLPKALLDDKYEKAITTVKEENYTAATIHIKDKDSKLISSIAIERFTNNADYFIEAQKIPADFDKVQQLSINGLDVLIFEDKGKLFIKYVDVKTKYEISLYNSDFEEAVKIAKTLK